MRRYILGLFLVGLILCMLSESCVSTASTHLNEGVKLYNQGEYDAAIAEFSKSIEINPKFAKAYYNRACAFEKKGDLEQAVSDFTSAIALNPQKDPTADQLYFYRGSAYETLMKYDLAMADYEKVISLNSDTSLVEEARSYLNALQQFKNK